MWGWENIPFMLRKKKKNKSIISHILVLNIIRIKLLQICKYKVFIFGW